MGVPGNVGAGRGYVDATTLGPVIESSAKYGSFGGVMIWDASQAYTNGNFIGRVKQKLKESSAHLARSIPHYFRA